jgi:hypothetical protein
MSQQRIYISSAAADRFFIDESRTDSVAFDLNEPIVCKSSERIYMSLETFAFSNSMYNITSDKNTLVIDNTTLTIPVGQYATANDLRTAIQTAITVGGFSTLTITYSALLNKFLIQNSSSTIDFILRATSKLAYVIGMNSTDISLIKSLTITLPRQVDLSNGRTINFAIRNLDFNGVDSNGDKALSSILCSVPISAKYGEIQTFTNPRDNRVLINRKNISSIEVNLINLNNQPFDLGGLKWSAVILVTIM